MYLYACPLLLVQRRGWSSVPLPDWGAHAVSAETTSAFLLVVRPFSSEAVKHPPPPHSRVLTQDTKPSRALSRALKAYIRGSSISRSMRACIIERIFLSVKGWVVMLARRNEIAVASGTPFPSLQSFLVRADEHSLRLRSHP